MNTPTYPVSKEIRDAVLALTNATEQVRRAMNASYMTREGIRAARKSTTTARRAASALFQALPRTSR